MNVQRLDHVVFAVQDLEAALATWAQTFGLAAGPVLRPEGVPLALAPLPVGERGAFLELAQPTAADHPLARQIDERGEGMLSLSFQVADLDAAVRELRAKGVPVGDPAPGLLPDTLIARIDRAASHGVAVQLIERS